MSFARARTCSVLV